MASHVQTRYRTSTQEWSTPSIVLGTDITVSGLSPGLNYGQQCFEGMKAFRTIDGRMVIFRPRFHAARMRRSASSVMLCPPDEELFLECVCRTVLANAEHLPAYESGEFLYIRPVLFGASSGIWGPCDESILAVFAHPTKAQQGQGPVSAIVCEDFDRCAPKGMGSYKVGGNYAPVWKYVGRAAMMGYGAVLHLDSATNSFVEEFSTSGFLGHKATKDGRDVLVVPTATSAIDSTTVDSLMKIAQRAGWIIERTKLPFSSIGDLNEVISCGTAAAATLIRSVERPSTGEKFTFDSCYDGWRLAHLAGQLRDIQYGRANDEEEWLWEITTSTDAASDDVVEVASSGLWKLLDFWPLSQYFQATKRVY